MSRPSWEDLPGVLPIIATVLQSSSYRSEASLRTIAATIHYYVLLHRSRWRWAYVGALRLYIDLTCNSLAENSVINSLRVLYSTWWKIPLSCSCNDLVDSYSSSIIFNLIWDIFHRGSSHVEADSNKFDKQPAVTFSANQKSVSEPLYFARNFNISKANRAQFSSNFIWYFFHLSSRFRFSFFTLITLLSFYFRGLLPLLRCGIWSKSV